MDREHLQKGLESFRHLLSHLHIEVTTLEANYLRVLLVLRELERNASLDDLTGLRRRRSFLSVFENVLRECEHQKTNCGILMIDIDHFKQLNDTHGHPTGDEVIKRVASLLKQYESPNCISGRFGGEEFAIGFRGTDAELLGLAEMIRRSAERLHGPALESDGTPSSRVEWKCTLSVGMASAQGLSYDASRLLSAADGALYEAKRKGRNQVRSAA